MGRKKRKARAGGKGRFSVKRKTEAVVRLLRGEDLDTLSRELGVTAAPEICISSEAWPAW